MREKLEAIFPGRPIGAVDRLHGASGADVHRVEVGAERFVLRLDPPGDGFRDPVRQHACQRIAAAAGVAPALVYAEGRVSVTAYLDATPSLDLPREVRLAAIARALATLHAAPCFPPLVDFMDGMDAIMAQFEAAGLLPAEVAAGHVQRYRELAARYPRGQDVVSSHNDLNPSNILFTGERAWFVDWETAFAADRYVDLAAIANFQAGDAAAEDLLLSTYFGAPATPEQRGRFELMKRINRYFYGVMLLNAAARERPGFRLGPDELDVPALEQLRAQMVQLATFDGRVRFGLAYLKASTI